MKRILGITLSLVLTVCMLTACGTSVRDKAIKEIENVKVSEYFKEDQEQVIDLADKYTQDIKKAKNDKAVEKELKSFRKDVKSFKTREDIVKDYIEKLEKKISSIKSKDKQKKAKDILSEYEQKLKDAESIEAFEKLTQDLEKKIEEATKVDVEVDTGITVSDNGTVTTTSSTKVVKKSTGSKNHSSNSGSNTPSSGSSSNSSSGGSKPSKPSHSHGWTPHYATGYRTETYYVTKYVCNGKYFDSYEAGYAYYIELGDQGIPSHLRPVDVEQTEQVPYQYIDYYYCSCGATK